MSEEELAPWIIMDIGFKGILLLVIFTIKAGFSLFKVSRGKWKDRVEVLQTNMFQANVMDFVGLVIRSLNSGALSQMNHFLKAFSFLIAIFFISVFTLEFIKQYT